MGERGEKVTRSFRSPNIIVSISLDIPPCVRAAKVMKWQQLCLYFSLLQLVFPRGDSLLRFGHQWLSDSASHKNEPNFSDSEAQRRRKNWTHSIASVGRGSLISLHFLIVLVPIFTAVGLQQVGGVNTDRAESEVGWGRCWWLIVLHSQPQNLLSGSCSVVLSFS